MRPVFAKCHKLKKVESLCYALIDKSINVDTCPPPIRNIILSSACHTFPPFLHQFSHQLYPLPHFQRLPHPRAGVLLRSRRCQLRCRALSSCNLFSVIHSIVFRTKTDCHLYARTLYNPGARFSTNLATIL